MTQPLTLHLGINGAFCARRWEQPETWMRLTRDLGFPCHEFSTDLLDPFLSGDLPFLVAQARAVREAAERHGVSIPAVHAGTAARRFHGLSHSDPIPRQRMVEWACATMDIAAAMGAQAVGGGWDAIAVETIERGEDAYRKAIADRHEILRDLARVARDKGLSALHVEQSCVPSEPPWTIKQAEEMLIELNRAGGGCPAYLALDVGRMAGGSYGLTGPDVDYREWLKTLAAFTPVVHLQQTTPEAVRNWPFTPRHNQRGHISMEAVLDAIRHGHEHHGESWVSEVLEPVSDCWLIVNVVPEPATTERALLDDLKTTADTLREFLPEGKLTLTV